MSWRDRLQAASFRKVPFFVESGDGTLGRRIDKHEYPQRDDAYIEDLGAIGNEFTVEAFILSDDNLETQRKALMNALNEDGPGVLVHPRLGSLRVQVGKVRWNFRKNNKESFSIPLYKAAANTQPTAKVDTVARVNTRCNSGLSAVNSSFSSRFNVDTVAGFVSDEAAALLSDSLQFVGDLNRLANVANNAVSDINQSIDAAINDVTTLIGQPLVLFNSVAAVITNVLNIDDDIDRALNAYRSIETSWGDGDSIPGTTPNRNQQRENQEAIAELFTTVAAIETVRLVSNASNTINVTTSSASPFASADHAYTVRNELIQTLDTIAATASDELYQAIGQLQAQFAAHIEAHGNTLPRVKTIRYHNLQSSLVIAHQLYGDANRADDIVARNNIVNPLFIDAGTDLEVLNA